MIEGLARTVAARAETAATEYFILKSVEGRLKNKSERETKRIVLTGRWTVSQVVSARRSRKAKG